MQFHPQRAELHNEIHARPPETVATPVVLTHIVVVADAATREASRAHVATLMREHHLSPPDAQAIHLRADLGAFRLRWELHTEFASYTLLRPLGADTPLDGELPRALEVVPQAWLAAMPGRVLCAMHLWALPTPPGARAALVRRLLREDSLMASRVADAQAELHTDLAIHSDGCSRALVFVDRLSPRRLGRLVQRVLEIETYRMAALLGLPVAREAGALLARGEAELAALAQAIRTAGREQEPELLDRLTRLAAEVESHYAATHSRFSASSAYFDLVSRRIADIAEQRLEGQQSVRDFLERRLTPAMNTCAWSVRRQQALSERISRMSNLLRTRVEIEQQQSSQALLQAMNERQGLQLKLQTTVEGLSVAAITYYVTGLIGYLTKGATRLGWPFSAEATVAASVPVVALAVWWSLRRLHHRVWKGR